MGPVVAQNVLMDTPAENGVPAEPTVDVLLERARSGDQSAFDAMLPLLYGELRALARRVRARNPAAETLNTTALVHEAYERMTGNSGRWADRAHFFRVASRAMRHILVDYSRRSRAEKRGGDMAPESLHGLELVADEKAGEILALDEALHRLSGMDDRQGQIVELRYFVGLTIGETAEVLGLSPTTVKREWTSARAWLRREIAS